MTDAGAVNDFAKRMAAYADRIIVRVVCSHVGKGFDGEPVVLVAFLDNGSVIPDYRYWAEQISEVGGRLEVVARSRGATPRELRPGTPRMRQVLECACGIRVPITSEDLRSLVNTSGAKGERFLELSALVKLIKSAKRARDDTP